MSAGTNFLSGSKRPNWQSNKETSAMLSNTQWAANAERNSRRSGINPYFYLHPRFSQYGAAQLLARTANWWAIALLAKISVPRTDFL